MHLKINSLLSVPWYVCRFWCWWHLKAGFDTDSDIQCTSYCTEIDVHIIFQKTVMTLFQQITRGTTADMKNLLLQFTASSFGLNCVVAHHISTDFIILTSSNNAYMFYIISRKSCSSDQHFCFVIRVITVQEFGPKTLYPASGFSFFS
jgi:hypothetical protein